MTHKFYILRADGKVYGGPVCGTPEYSWVDTAGHAWVSRALDAPTRESAEKSAAMLKAEGFDVTVKEMEAGK